MEYSFKYDEVAKELIFYQLHVFDDSASGESNEQEEEEDIHPDNAYFYFSFPVVGLSQRKDMSYATSTMNIFPKKEDNVFSIKIEKINEYTFKLDLPQSTFNKVKQALEKASVNPSGGKKRRTRRKTFTGHR